MYKSLNSHFPYSLSRLLLLTLLTLALWLYHTTLLASDHIDGKITIKHAVVDITDLYAFPDPKQTHQLILVMNAYPFAPRTAHFTERVQYNFVTRQLTPQENGLQSHHEQRISCTFATPKTQKTQHINCQTTTGLTVSNAIDDTQGGTSNAGFKVFAGRRADPFFVNVDWLLSAGREGKLLAATDGDDSFKNMNVLSIVLSLDINKLYPNTSPSLLAISAETLTQDEPQAAWRRLDRKGRAEISNVTLAPNGGVIQDQYNAENTFAIDDKNKQLYQKAMLKSLRYYDQLDQKIDWQPAKQQALVNYLLDDYLIVDMSKPCQLGEEYLSIENALLAGKAHTSCGGRHLNDDIIDRIFSLYVNADTGNTIRDGVNQPSATISTTFPYLAEPENGWLAAFKAFITRTVIQW